jgi:hypothetical protein
MRLDPREVPGLPFPALLADPEGRPVVGTPEWRGPGPGTISYQTGFGHLLVAPDLPAPELDVLVDRLLAELAAATAAMEGEPALQVDVLRAGMELVAGRPPTGKGTAEDVVVRVAAAVRARTRRLQLEVARPLPGVAVAAPAAVALALVQLAVNAERHDGARRVLLRVTPGPSFWVEWSGGGLRPGVRPHRHPARRARWGWAYVQMVADALGGVAVPPGPAGPGLLSAGIGLGAPRLTLPLACCRAGRVERATEAWEQDPQVPVAGHLLQGPVAELVCEAARRPGQIVYHDLYRARACGQRTWVGLGPESALARARDLVRGLGHERALWRAPEPWATRVSALVTLLQVALGDPWPAVPPGLFQELMEESCQRLGVQPPGRLDALLLPEPRAAAYLLGELGGRLVTEEDVVYLIPGPHSEGDPLLEALGASGGRLRLAR